MARIQDLTGQKFTRLTVIGIAEKCTGKHIKWLCRCDCGKEKAVSGYALKSGLTRSCGCLQKEIAINNCKLRSKHRLINTPLYGVWASMKIRCYNKNRKEYKNYGARGITVCDEWKDDFKAFYEWAMANGYKEGLSIDRINNDGDYEPSNCRWATWCEQCRNRRTNRHITYNGETHLMTDWARMYNIPVNVFQSRLRRGWNFGDIISKPIKKKKSSNKM